MPKLDILKIDGTAAGTLEVPTVLTIEPKKQLLHQAVVTYMANNRLSNAHTKTRGEVRGGGRKPWKQKGTGRARAGSSRSPIWVGGGITFGPRSIENFSKRLPDKMKRMALAMALSMKISEGKVTIVDALTITEPKTKNVAALVSAIAPTAASVLLVTTNVDRLMLQASRNLSNTALINASDLNTFDVLNFGHLIIAKDAVEILEKQLGSEK
jgi:large subunit ribosomal protein L4